MKKHWSLSILVLFCLYFSKDYIIRFNLPMHDEALYASGNTQILGWSPLYPFMYQILHFFTDDKIQSFKIMLFSLSFIATPLISYFFSRKLKFSIIQSLTIALIA